MRPPRRRPLRPLQALRDSGAVGLGAFPMGIAFGVLVVHSGLRWWWASVFSSLIYAGSLEFLFLGLVLATVPLAQVALTAFLVNFRHVFYALSFPLHQIKGRAARAYSTFALSDEVYAVTANEAAQSYSSRRILLLQGFIHLYWAGGATMRRPARLDRARTGHRPGLRGDRAVHRAGHRCLPRPS